tara:strand:+ start:149 stop:283 length:135 start_codon:yes stop_codon:yes gene_type:complete
MKKYQIVNWFPEINFGFKRLKETGLANIYEWSLGIFFWEIRKWV